MAGKKYSIEQFSPGILIETEVKRKIEPGVLELDISENFTSTISILDLDWNLSRAEIKFKSIRKGDRIQAAVFEVSPSQNHIRLSVRHLLDKPFETQNWKDLKLGNMVSGKTVDRLSNGQVIELDNGLTGVIFEHSYDGNQFQVVKKDRVTNLLTLSKPKELDLSKDQENKELPQSGIIIKDEDFRSFQNFTKSIYKGFAEKDSLDFLESAFEIEPQLFSKEFVAPNRLYLSFGLTHSAWENFQYQVVAGLLNKTNTDESITKEAIEFIKNQTFWINISKRDKGSDSFTIYNEQLSFHGVINLFDDESCQFFILSTSFGRKDYKGSKGKQHSSINGSFVLREGISILTPTDNVPIGETKDQVGIYERLTLKNQAFQIISDLKSKTGEIIRSSGKSLQIFDKFLEYQIDQAKKSLPAPFLLKEIKRTQGSEHISWILPPDVDDYFGKDEEGDIYLDLKEKIKSTKKDREYEHKKIGSAKARQFGELWLLLIEDSLPLNEVKELYIQKKASLRQFQVQREIIRDFFDKKLKLDHIENLLVDPKRISAPIVSPAQLINENLKKTENEQSDNTQIKAVRKAIGNKDIFLIQGPPGTGKTTVIAEVVNQLVNNGEKILVTSQTHIAVDNVLEKLTKEKSLSLLRLGAKNKIRESLQSYHPSEQIHAYTNDFLKFIDTQKTIIKLWSQGKNQEDITSAIKILREDYSDVIRDKLARFNFDLVALLISGKITNIDSILETLEKWTGSLESGLEKIIAPILYSSIDVVFATCIGIKLDKEFSEIEFKFDTVIIDEAGKANLAESLAAISMAKKIILVGDQKQLPPYIESDLLDTNEDGSFPRSKFGYRFGKEETEYALKTSFFEFLIKRIDRNQFPPTNKEMLNYQHRMHPSIGKFVSESFYDGILNMGSSTHLNELVLPAPFKKEIIFFSTGAFNDPYEEQNGFSIINRSEALIVVQDILPKLIDYGLKETQIAVIAPYKSQVALIKKEIEISTNQSLNNIEVATLDSFQGMEFDVIVFSFTRSASPNQEKKRVGFLDDARRLNVAFSRAKKKLILVGNSRTLTHKSSHYDGLFDFTRLFQKLEELSNDESIGAFYESNDDDFDFKSPHERFKEKHPVGSMANGIVKALVPFGAFVTISGIDGLVHKSNISQYSITDLSDVLEVGQEVKVMILSINDIDKKLSLGLKQVSYFEFKNKYPVGSIINGKVKTIVEYGAYISAYGQEGLLRKSNINARDKTEFSELIKVDQEIKVYVFSYDDQKQNLAFSIQKPKTNIWDLFKKENPIMSKIRVKVSGVTEYGIFVNLSSGYTGLIHISQLNPIKREGLKNQYTKGEFIDALILNYNDKKKQIELSETLAMLKNKSRNV